MENTIVPSGEVLKMEIENVAVASLVQELQERCRATQEAFEREEKARIELESLNTKLLAEKTDLLRQLEGEAGSLQEYQERSVKLAAQKLDLESQLLVSVHYSINFSLKIIKLRIFHLKKTNNHYFTSSPTFLEIIHKKKSISLLP